MVDEKISSKHWKLNEWLDTGDEQYVDDKIAFSSLPANLYGAEWIALPSLVSPSIQTVAKFRVNEDADIFIALDRLIKDKPVWLNDYEDTKTSFGK
jgi:hypothetical protein